MHGITHQPPRTRPGVSWPGILVCILCAAAVPLLAQDDAARPQVNGLPHSRRIEQPKQPITKPPSATRTAVSSGPDDYKVGPEDVLEVSIFEAPELNHSFRVSATGEISMPLVGTMQVAGRTAREVEVLLEDRLRHSFMRDPHVGVYVKEMESHPVSVVGAVKKPGVFRIAEPKSLLEMLSMAEGLAEDAGDQVVIMRGASFADPVEPSTPVPSPQTTSVAAESPRSIEVDLRKLLNSTDRSLNVMIEPGDIVKVNRAGLVYVLGDVKKPGGFLLRNNENITVLQALALAEGALNTSAKNRVRIIRTGEEGGHTEIPLNVDMIMKGKAPDQMLQARDIVFVPKSGSKAALYRGVDAIVATVPAAAVYGRL